MNRKTLIIVIALILALAIGGAAGWYWVWRSGAGIGNNIFANKPIDSNNQEIPGVIVRKKDFSIKIPAGWQEIPVLSGVSLLVADISSSMSGFRSYYSVVRDSLKGRTEKEYWDYYRTQAEKSTAGIKFVSQSDQIVSNQKMHILETEIKDGAGVYKALVVLIRGKNDDIWTLVFNSSQGDWGKIGPIFQDVIKNFSLS